MIPYHRPFKIRKTEIDLELERILDSGMYSNDKCVKALEEGIADYLNIENVVACSSCTQGLITALRALDWRGGVHIPDFTWRSTELACEYQRDLRPIYDDIDGSTWFRKDVPVRDYLIPVDVFGSRYPLNPDDFDRTVIDAAHSLGTKGVGNRAIIEVFSMSPTKTATSGEGGLIAVNDTKYLERVIKLRDLTSRMSEFNALIGLTYLKKLSRLVFEKKKIANYYKTHLPFEFQEIPFDSNFYVVAFRAKDRDGVKLKLEKEKISYKIYFEPLTGLTNSTKLYSEILCIPSWVGVDYKRITEVLNG